ncbi:MAG: DNA-processing protein DprA [Candidatus Viridilinea halotolerans]|uniref:DNA-processing protein DprA n=1 Tax=Candidatus Viridilinea halotolerans TaxID=2491704 RepID=A0A426TQA4_9CHLR|nr:MAG: DNA-processing protein DprA [Candidatus Viridilinea halotolerans]
MHNHILTPDTQTVLLLCGSLGQPRAREAPLTQGEYNQVAQWLQREQLRPADLLQADGLVRLQAAGATLPLAGRVADLVARGAALGLAVEAWTNKGLWVMSRSDPDYPRALRNRLKLQAPPILYGVGERSLLQQGGIAIVGSRDADEKGLAFAQSVALRCSEQGFPVISGGARGVDSSAMDAALEGEGLVVGILADGLARAAVARKYRAAFHAGRLVLLSPFDPDAGFNTGNAMQRNKAIYAMSDLALVVSATLEKGGTWSGATENLKHGWVPLFVRAEEPQLAGNRRLIELGGYSVDRRILNQRVSATDWLAGRELASNLDLPLAPPRQQAGIEAAPLPPKPADALEHAPEARAAAPLPPKPAAALEHAPETDDSKHDLFGIVWPYIKEALATPRSDREIAELFHLELKQAQTWLRRATEQGTLQKLNKPVRYVALHTKPTLPLFEPHEATR